MARSSPLSPVTEHDQIMLVTDQGKVIRIPVDGIRIAGRNTQGVTLFNTDKDEHVVSVARLEGAADIEDEELDDDDRAPDDENGGQESEGASQENGSADKNDAPPDSS